MNTTDSIADTDQPANETERALETGDYQIMTKSDLRRNSVSGTSSPKSNKRLNYALAMIRTGILM
jgi:hypothetical protein